MTPQEVDTREERVVSRLSTSDLAEAIAAPEVSNAPAANPVQERSMPLFAKNDAQDFRSRWERVQIGFVDEPRQAVEQADELVAGAIKRLAEVFSDERKKLESEWDKTDNVSTEDLRIALRRYRSFFDRLLSV
jgi:hypothetical protein